MVIVSFKPKIPELSMPSAWLFLFNITIYTKRGTKNYTYELLDYITMVDDPGSESPFLSQGSLHKTQN